MSWRVDWASLHLIVLESLMSLESACQSLAPSVRRAAIPRFRAFVWLIHPTSDEARYHENIYWLADTTCPSLLPYCASL